MTTKTLIFAYLLSTIILFRVPMFIFISSNLYFFHYQLHSYVVVIFSVAFYPFYFFRDPFAKEKQDDH